MDYSYRPDLWRRGPHQRGAGHQHPARRRRRRSDHRRHHPGPGQGRGGAAGPKQAEDQLKAAAQTLHDLAARADYLARWAASIEQAAGKGTTCSKHRSPCAARPRPPHHPPCHPGHRPGQPPRRDRGLHRPGSRRGKLHQGGAGRGCVRCRRPPGQAATTATVEKIEKKPRPSSRPDRTLPVRRVHEGATAEDNKPHELPQLMGVFTRLLILTVEEGDLRPDGTAPPANWRPWPPRRRSSRATPGHRRPGRSTVRLPARRASAPPSPPWARPPPR